MFGFLTFFKVPLNRVTKLIFIILASLGENNCIERNSIQNLLYFSICPHLVLKFRFSHLGSQFQYLHLNSKLQYNHLLSQSLSVQLKFKISVSALTLRIPQVQKLKHALRNMIPTLLYRWNKTVILPSFYYVKIWVVSLPVLCLSFVVRVNWKCSVGTEVYEVI